MRWLVVVAVLVLAHPLKAEEVSGRIDNWKRGATEWWRGLPELSIPPMPTIPPVSLPGLPAPSMPDLMKEFDAFAQQVSDSVPILEEMGYEVASFRIQWGLPPKARLRIRSRGTVDTTRLSLAVDKAKGGLIMAGLVSSAASAKRIQSSMKLGTAILDVEFALPPKVRMSFLKRGGELLQQPNERDPEEFALACRDAGLDN
jgi:hypothetical protein